MDGLTLMAKSKQEHIEVDYLIISGYSDFAYAQKPSNLEQRLPAQTCET